MRVVLLLLAALLAGCSQDAEPEVPSLVSDTTGLIRGVVVDPAVVPIEGARVTLQDGTSTTTDPSGAFQFTEVPGGVHALIISKQGFSDVASTATVRPADAAPPVLKIQMSPDASTASFVESEVFSGFVERAATAGTARYGASDAPDQFFDIVPTWFQAEMVWRSTQALGDRMDLTFISFEEGAATGQAFARAIGPSPLANGVSRDQMVEANIGGENRLALAIFTATNDPVPAGVTVDQPYDLFLHRFYGFAPPEGWQFSQDGLPEP